MDFELTLPVSVGIVLAIIAIGTVAMFNVMVAETVLMMVLPSMLVFAAIVFAIGVKHGEYRASAH